MATRKVTTVTPAQLGRLLRKACKEHGGAAKLAKRANVSVWTIYNIRDGKQKLSEAVALALGVKKIWVLK